MVNCSAAGTSVGALWPTIGEGSGCTLNTTKNGECPNAALSVLLYMYSANGSRFT